MSSTRAHGARSIREAARSFATQSGVMPFSTALTERRCTLLGLRWWYWIFQPTLSPAGR
ncbi:hypothetical protein [Streptomyces cyaneofuscatus]|uniref:hypothetical protein n=1 Tax=Streptomyces cyaneofuscatus TaxID=66883 RepID=UPI0036507AE1